MTGLRQHQKKKQHVTSSHIEGTLGRPFPAWDKCGRALSGREAGTWSSSFPLPWAPNGAAQSTTECNQTRQTLQFVISSQGTRFRDISCFQGLFQPKLLTMISGILKAECKVLKKCRTRKKMSTFQLDLKLFSAKYMLYHKNFGAFSARTYTFTTWSWYKLMTTCLWNNPCFLYMFQLCFRVLCTLFPCICVPVCAFLWLTVETSFFLIEMFVWNCVAVPWRSTGLGRVGDCPTRQTNTVAPGGAQFGSAWYWNANSDR